MITGSRSLALTVITTLQISHIGAASSVNGRSAVKSGSKNDPDTIHPVKEIQYPDPVKVLIITINILCLAGGGKKYGRNMKEKEGKERKGKRAGKRKKI